MQVSISTRSITQGCIDGAKAVLCLGYARGTDSDPPTAAGVQVSFIPTPIWVLVEDDDSFGPLVAPDVKEQLKTIRGKVKQAMSVLMEDNSACTWLKDVLNANRLMNFTW